MGNLPVPVININIDYDSVFLPVYKPLLSTEAKLRFLYGGRDSGKSRDIAQRKVLDCLMKPFFRCILIKKTHSSIKDSQWQLIKDVCEDWCIDHLFDFRTSPLEIRCKVNGNRFICRGMDDPAKIKSINDPTDAWCEEGNQLTLQDWIYIITTLRSSKGPVTIDMSFNTETKGDYQEFWLYKEYFSHTTEKSFTHVKTIKFGNEQVHIKYIAIHSTYRDNPYVSIERKAYHEGLQDLNFYWYKVFTLGEWGNEENDSPWLFAFDRFKHVAPAELHADKKDILYTSWDFNRNPQVCTIIQWPKQKMVKIIEVIKITNVGTEGICDVLLQKYPGYLYMVTGDYSGDTPSSLYKEQVTNYTIIKNKLRLSDGQIKISPNPRLEKNQTLVNTIFNSYPVQICPVKCKPFIYDAENVKKRADGTIVKVDRNDPAQQADVLDTGRYWFNQFMPWYIKENIKLKADAKLLVTLPSVEEYKNEPFKINSETIEASRRGIDVIDDAIVAISNGNHVICSKSEYKSMIRNAILNKASVWVNAGDSHRAQLALIEVQRLDNHFKISSNDK